MGCVNSKQSDYSPKIIYCPSGHAMKYKALKSPKSTCSSCYGIMT